MSTLDTNSSKKYLAKTGFIYILISIFCMVFGLIYEYYSHGVYSNYMIYAFAFPLVGGALPFTVMSLYKIKRLPNRLTFNLYNSGIATLTIGSIMQGVINIYGTTNNLLIVFWVVGIALSLISLLLYFISDTRKDSF